MNETVDPATTRVAEPTPAPIRPLTAPPRRKRRWPRWLAAIVLAVVAFIAFERWEKLAPGTVDANKPAEKTTPPQTVRAASAERGDMPITIDALGSVTPLATITIKTQISGKLMSVGFQEGQLVKTGDLIAQIDSRPYEAALAQAQAQLAKDTAAYQQAQADLARYQTLNRQDSIAKQQVDDQVFLVAQDKAAIGVDQAQIDTAKLNLNYTRILSPINGRVGLRLVDPGNYVQPSDATGLVVITQLDPITVDFNTPEEQSAAHRAARRRRRQAACDRRSTAPTSRRWRPANSPPTTIRVDTTTGTVKMRASFANPDNTLFPSQFVNVRRLLVDTQKNVVLVPNAAVQLGQSGPFAYVVKDGKTVEVRKIQDRRRRQPAYRSSSRDWRRVESVVIDGVDRLRDGAAIRLVGAKPAATDAGAGTGEHQHRHKRDQATP